MGRNCEVCSEAQFKYKCPACLAPYCSVACFKKHKESLCQKSQPPVEESTTKESTQATQPLEEKSLTSNVEVKVYSRKAIEVEEESWAVSKEQLYSLAECKEIRDALKSEELQNLISRIDSSEEPEKELDKAMEGQVFSEFTEKILDIISQRDS